MAQQLPGRQPDDLFKESTMSFGEHLDELRVCLWKCMLGLVVGTAAGLYWGANVVKFVQFPVEQALKVYTKETALQQAQQRKLNDDLPGATATIEQGYYFEEWLVEPGQLAQALGVSETALGPALHPDGQPATPTGPNVAVEPGRNSPTAKRLDGLEITPTGIQAEPLATLWVTHQAAQQPFFLGLWKLLTPAEQALLTQLSAPGSRANDADRQALAQLLNRICQDPAVIALARQPLPQDSDWRLSETTQRLLASVPSSPSDGAQVSAPPTAASRRLARLVLQDALRPTLSEPTLTLIPLVLWKRVEQHPRATAKVFAVMESFSIYMTASLVLGASLASPWIFYQLWLFVAAGLYPHERKYVYFYGPVSLLLFLMGVAVAFFLVFPPVLGFLFDMARSLGIEIDLRLSEWIHFVLLLPLGFGISFQLPLVMLFLHRVGIFSIQQYISQWRIAVMAIFVISAVLTPADPQSMLYMALPLTVLYGGGLILCWLMPREAPAAPAA